ncbi:minor histocompatibility protein HB-1 [Nomascus leucogenys]|uniref:minor histocompatibility protein HB-1 n=1 Tax=Nomascus leucogenys TaxID=61853 RepID=UPI00122D92B7|nr:minor histocompatibility protein HB-1 [Nomascus leucogenys]
MLTAGEELWFMGPGGSVEKPELEEQPECREEKRGSLHVWKSELIEVEDDVYLRHSSSLTYKP